jgi:carboxyl-terminal processing protease
LKPDRGGIFTNEPGSYMSVSLKSIFLSLLLFCSLDGLYAQENPVAYMKSALDIMKQNAVKRASLNWPSIYKHALDAVQDKKSNKETYPVILNTLSSLEDSHSKFFPPEMVADYLKRYEEAGLQFPYPEDSMIQNTYAYLTLPAIGNLNRPDWELYVSDFYKKALKLDQQQPKAWIIDLLENTGGMFAPMFAAIQPFLDREQVVGSKDNKGVITYFKCNKGIVSFGERIIDTIHVPLIHLQHKDIPVYILAGKKTSSSGEFVVAGFVGQKNAIVIGTNTQGLTSDNSEFKLSDGAFLVLTTGNLVDRNKKEYYEIGKGISPSLEFKSDQPFGFVSLLEGLK